MLESDIDALPVGIEFFKLTAMDHFNTITVSGDGVLTLAGVIVTHEDGKNGRGVTVSSSNGKLFMSGGMITNNIYTGDGGGVSNLGTFVMSGGMITNNNNNSPLANRLGGGVYNSGSFVMSGDSSVANNIANTGGGVSNSGTFVMSGDSSVVNNNANSFGGGVHMFNVGSFTMFDCSSVVANNAGSGGGVSA